MLYLQSIPKFSKYININFLNISETFKYPPKISRYLWKCLLSQLQYYKRNQSKPQETHQRQSFCWFSNKIINMCNSFKYTLQRQQKDYYRVPHFVNLGVVKVTGS